MLNLLPPEKKQALQREFLWRRLLSFSWMLFFALTIFTGLLISTWLYASIQFRAIEQSVYIAQTSPQGQKIKGLEDKIKETNLNLKYLEELKLNQNRSFSIIEALVNLAPVNIRFKSVSLDLTTDQGSISGFAQKRSDLLTFKEGLEKSNSFQQIALPLSHLLKEQNIDFTLSFSLK